MPDVIISLWNKLKMRNPCKECVYYNAENNTCQSKKCGTGGEGYVTLLDKLFCKPLKLSGGGDGDG